MNESSAISKSLVCHHCSEPCPDNEIAIDNKYFCCYGCKSVHELLENAGLSSHFKEISNKNTSIAQQKAEKKYGFLETPDYRNNLIRYADDNQSRIVLSLPGIHCSSCIYLLEHLPQLDKSILRSEVNFLRKEVTITFLHRLSSVSKIAVLLSQLGYPPEISSHNLDGSSKKKTKSRLGVQVAVAGFCFGNAMLMSMPEYLDQKLLLTDHFKSLFSWINLGLSIPVMLHSARDYFITAWRGIRAGTLNIDVPIALGILTLFLRSAFEIISTTGMGYVDSLAGLVFFLLIGKWYQSKTYQALSFERDYASYFPVVVTCLENGTEKQKSLKDLIKGDLVLIHNDELIPADGELISPNACLDYSFVTGESAPTILRSKQKVFAGGRQKGPEITIKLDREVSTSELTSLWNSDVFKKDHPDLRLWVDKLSKYFTATIIALAIGTGIFWSIVDPTQLWNAVTAVLIVACPCALALVLPFTYGHAIRLLGRHGLYLKNAEIIESLAKIKEIVFDKTGTLTSNEATISYHGTTLTDNQKSSLKSALSNSSHPLSQLIFNYLKGYCKQPISSFDEKLGCGFSCEINGHNIKVGSAEHVGMSEEETNSESRVHIYIDSYLGYYGLQSTYRTGLFESLSRLKETFKMHLLSGDNDSHRQRLTPYFDKLSFSQRPKDKLAYLQSQTNQALMLGDGLNDAGALKSASVGIAVTGNIHQFSPACDGILSADKLNTLPEILSFSKHTKSIVFVAFGLSFLYNIIGLSFAISGQLTPLISAILMPLSSVTVVGFVTLMVMVSGQKFD